ncbi:hypothetical protein ACL02S_15750 [Nocardia sp. 004]|uniref:hypothetical protein n=1 Tax=Nocardia sp. 004 TaxID=3385978 RepID=UPI0039A1BF86
MRRLFAPAAALAAFLLIAAAPVNAAPGVSRDDPVPFAVSAKVGSDWEVQVLRVDENADAVVHAENRFNAPPAAGRQFVIVVLAVRYVGEESGIPWTDLDFAYVTRSGNSYRDYEDDSMCGVIPRELSDVGELFPGASATANLCYSLPVDQIDGATLLAEEFFGSAPRVFFELLL